MNDTMRLFLFIITAVAVMFIIKVLPWLFAEKSADLFYLLLYKKQRDRSGKPITEEDLEWDYDMDDKNKQKASWLGCGTLVIVILLLFVVFYS